MLDRDTIAAIATAHGKGGIGIVRLSGPAARHIGEQVCGKPLPLRMATHARFHAVDKQVIDEGIGLFFAAPASFTGEDVVELHGHGGLMVPRLLLDTVLALGARMARPGEFSERAFLNGKLDLVQAEAIADLIEAGSAQAARNAIHSLQGVFSRAVNTVADQVLQLRLYIEAALDFPEEEIDFLADGKVAAQLQNVLDALHGVLAQAKQGALLREGIRVVIAGKPNVGKSSLLNALAQRDVAIVTDIPGTTRDVLREQVMVAGIPLHIIDTAGLRDSADPVEQEGIRRARQEMAQADVMLLLVDSSAEPMQDASAAWQALDSGPLPAIPVLLVLNKIDCSGLPAGDHNGVLQLSARTGAGMDALVNALQHAAGLHDWGEGAFSARSRHLDALRRALDKLEHALLQFQVAGAGELLAEDLREAHACLGEITGHVSADELLGRIFSSFCIGK